MQEPDPLLAGGPGACRSHLVTRIREHEGVQHEADLLAEETAVALEYNGISHATLLASPCDLEDLAYGFSYTEGIIDHLRSVEGTKVAALAREVESGGIRKKVSLRSTDGEVDVSAIARAGGGGGHRQAAGFTTELSDDELVAFLREQIAAQLALSSR